jgi:hypothetical protein
MTRLTGRADGTDEDDRLLMPMDEKALLQEYRTRWEEVAEIERAEQKRKTVAQRLQLLDTLFRFAIASGIYRKALIAKQREAEAARQRWLRLKGLYGF